MLETIVESKNREAAPLPAERTSSRLTSGQEAVVELLLTTAQILGEQNAINPSVIASRKELERLTQGDLTVNALQGWRRKLAGETLLAVLQGKLGLRIIDDTVHLIEAD